MGNRDWDGSFTNRHASAGRKRFCEDARSTVPVDEDFYLSKNDLRHKIMKSHRLKQSHSEPKEVDLRDILSRPSQSSTGNIGSHKRKLEHNFETEHLEPNHGRKPSTDIRDGRDFLSLSKHSSQSITHPPFKFVDDPRHHQILETSGNGCEYLEMREDRCRMPMPLSIDHSVTCGVHGMSTYNGSSKLEPVTESYSYSPWTLDSLRKTSPDESFATSSGVIASRRCEISQYINPPSQTLVPKMNRIEDPFEISRSQSVQYMPEVAPPVGNMRSSNGISQMEPSYSPWTQEGISKRSPDQSFGTCSGFMGSKRDETTHYTYPLSYASSKTNVYQDTYDTPRPQSIQYLSEVPPPLGQITSSVPLPPSLHQSGFSPRMNSHALQLPPSLPHSVFFPQGISDTVPLPPPHLLSGNFPQRSSNAVDFQDTVESFLVSLGLERFIINFKLEEVDMFSLKRMSESDLTDMGIPMGPRKKIFYALKPRSMRPLS